MPCVARTIIILAIGAILALPSNPPSVHSSDAYDILGRIVSEYNLDVLKKDLQKGQFCGEAGILGASPEVAQSFGLSVYMDRHYFEGKKLRQKGEDSHRQLLEMLKASSSGHLRKRDSARIAQKAAEYNKIRAEAQKRFQAYLENLYDQDDERLDEDKCLLIIKRLLKQTLGANGNNLREGLAMLYNRLRQDGSHCSPALNTSNVRFVNHVVREFSKRADSTGKFHLDKILPDCAELGWKLWHLALDQKEARFEKLLRQVFGREKKGKNSVMDPVLFISLIKKESNFDPRAVSCVGAAGLTQLMPGTAKQLGMKNIFAPPYFFQARKLLRTERRLRAQAISLVESISRPNMAQTALKAMKTMRRSTDTAQRRAKLFKRYKMELLSSKKDDRLDPKKALICGYRYLNLMLNRFGGDMSLALAAYNAGPNRVAEYQGIPPFEETVDFRNRILHYYKEYWKRIKARRGTQTRWIP